MEEMKEIRMKDLFNNKQIRELTKLLNKKDLKGLREYLNQTEIKDMLEKKGVLADYLYYFLEHKLGK